MRFKEAKAYILNRLKTGLPAQLTYHRYEHTIDVYEQTKRIAKLEGISDKVQYQWLKTAALFHDCGFLNVYRQHEEEGCRIATEILPGFDYTPHDIEIICGMIMATRIPQTPRNHLEEIIADADLDYLGRSDFYTIGDTLRQELLNMQAIQNNAEWDPIQINFLRSHHYFTATSKRERAGEKEKRLHELIAAVEAGSKGNV
jgi:uncharacterized protein